MRTEAKSAPFLEGHPDENQLFLALERELTADECAKIDQHLGGCWKCRARFDEMQQGVLAFVAYREKRYLPMRPTPPNEYRDFQRRLRNAAQEQSDSGLLAALAPSVAAFFRFPWSIRWASVVALAMAIIILYVQVIHPPLVSANELLERAVAAQNPAPASGARGTLRTVRQTVEISSGGRTVVKTFAWQIGSAMEQAQWRLESGVDLWNTPFTAGAFAAWRSSLRERTDSVKRSGGLLLLDTVASGDAIREAWIAVRASDFHPVEQHLRFRDNRELSLRELRFEIQDQAPANEKPRAEVAWRAPQSAPAPKAESTAKAADLNEIELQLRYTLFAHQLDLDDDLKLAQSDGVVVLSGTVNSAEGEQNIRSTLSGLPHVKVAIIVPQTSMGVAGNAPRSAPRSPSTGSLPLLQHEVETAFPAGEERAAFIDGCVTASDNAISHAWALKRLVDRYDETQTRGLNSDSQHKLWEMLSAHLAQLGKATAQLNGLAKLLDAASNRLPSVSASNWRGQILELFQQVQRQDHAVTALVIGPQNAAQDLASAGDDFRSSHARIDRLLRDLGNFRIDSLKGK